MGKPLEVVALVVEDKLALLMVQVADKPVLGLTLLVVVLTAGKLALVLTLLALAMDKLVRE